MNTHEIYIKRCLELAQNGLPTAMPNPSVGGVIVFENKIIGEGFTSKYGGNHAEVNAINAVKDKSLLSKSTIYVSLEPCSHFGKTPPCADLIIKNKIPNVVIGTLDSNEKVAGNGIKKLIEAGINVTVGILEEECKASNKRFFTFHEKKRPYIILKWAESQDGFITPTFQQDQSDKKEPIWITNEVSRQLVHKWRSEEQAILVGTKTVLDDNPKLDVRDWKGNNPIRIVLDKTGKISNNYNVKDDKIKTIVITEQENFVSSDYLHYEKCIFDNQLVASVCEILYKNNIQSVIIEGGTKTIQSFIDANIWDEARVFKSKIVFENGTKAPIINYKNAIKQSIIDDELLKIYNL
ncbi:bifunctional diaminohydroxyphosphoribosylaminopyrimidine deaminase/5-amino-6-(5-phosphoribosylamino)uracil reductase RibD [Flavobacterium sp.]|uniref:bifunctional diaminohydroxyphosphoribosylaminopyrimidine deaminase/5-amino-6-(5-phosphoribosylamino)uracil reductase RibD n=1 Tax=Flavobacterium sp. TaxID=239 RepID=UPI0037537453